MTTKENGQHEQREWQDRFEVIAERAAAALDNFYSGGPLRPCMDELAEALDEFEVPIRYAA